MARPKLVFVKLLRNRGARIKYRSTRGERERFERPNGSLTIREAAMLLDTYPNMIYRMAAAGRLAITPGRIRTIGLGQLRELVRLPKSDRATAAPPQRGSK